MSVHVWLTRCPQSLTHIPNTIWIWISGSGFLFEVLGSSIGDLGFGNLGSGMGGVVFGIREFGFGVFGGI